jgi:peptidoglycan/xylan/chitin deacetylase (PgdA/CDA1 family)
VLEVKDASYARNLGDRRVTQFDVLDIDASNPHATIVADLAHAGHVPAEQFDCFILTQTLHIIYDIRAAVSHAARLLKPGGVLLCTIPALSRVNYEDGGLDGGDYWRLTEAAVRQLFAEVFPLDHFEVRTYGNVRVCTAFLYGLACEDLAPADLDVADPWFPLIHCVRAVKPSSAPAITRTGSTNTGAIVLYHRVGDANPDPFGLCIHPSQFVRHMQHLKATCEVLSLQDLADAAASGSIPDRAVSVTFDDAYLDNLTTASPILLDLGIPATFFATTERLDEQREFWWDTLTRLVMEEPVLPTLLNVDAGAVQPVRSGDDRERVLREIHGLIRPLPAAGRDHALRSISEQIRPTRTRPPLDRPMTTDELRQLASRPGHDVGAHTTHHLDLPFQPVETQRREISESKARLELALGRPVTAFAYPFGHATPATAALVDEARYRVAVVVESAPVMPGLNSMRLPRAEILPATDFAAALDRLLSRRSGQGR